MAKEAGVRCSSLFSGVDQAYWLHICILDFSCGPTQGWAVCEERTLGQATDTDGKSSRSESLRTM